MFAATQTNPGFDFFIESNISSPLTRACSVSRLRLIRFSTFKIVEDSVHATISRKEEKKKKKKHGIQIRNAWNFKCEIHALISRLPYIPYILNPSRSPIFARLSTVPKRIETRREIEANRERTKSFMSPE